MATTTTTEKVSGLVESIRRRLSTRRIRHESLYDAAGRLHRCHIASEQALRDLERAKLNGRLDQYVR